MKSFTLFLVLCLQLLFLFSTLDNTANAGLIKPTVRVEMYNKLPEESQLTIHCKSGDDDLGRQLINFRGFYDFSFRPNIFGTTLFFCAITWNKENIEMEHDIYEQKRDMGRCQTRCKWDVSDKGLLGFREDTGENDITYEWSRYGK